MYNNMGYIRWFNTFSVAQHTPVEQILRNGICSQTVLQSRSSFDGQVLPHYRLVYDRRSFRIAHHRPALCSQHLGG